MTTKINSSLQHRDYTEHILATWGLYLKYHSNMGILQKPSKKHKYYEAMPEGVASTGGLVGCHPLSVVIA